MTHIEMPPAVYVYEWDTTRLTVTSCHPDEPESFVEIVGRARGVAVDVWGGIPWFETNWPEEAAEEIYRAWAWAEDDPSWLRADRLFRLAALEAEAAQMTDSGADERRADLARDRAMIELAGGPGPRLDLMEQMLEIDSNADIVAVARAVLL